MRFPITGADIALTIIFIIVAFIVSNNISEKYIHKAAYFKHLQKGLFIRFGAGLFFAWVYLIFYGGGDTIYYFSGAGSIAKLALKDFGGFIQVMGGERGYEVRSLFDWQTGWPTYIKDANAFTVCRAMVPFYILGGGSYWATTILVNAVLYIPLWKFYQMICSMYPKQSKQIAWGILFFPSLVFWSSGILKDVWCLTSLMIMYRAFYYTIIKKRNHIKNILLFAFWSYILLSIRPFMFYTGIATILLWYGFNATKNIKNPFIRYIAFPIIMGLILGGIQFSIAKLGDVAEGKYATVDSMLETAVVIQDDLSRTEAYGENTFDIGDFDATIPSMLSKFPQAVTAGLARPFIWEAGSILMFFTGLESSFFIYMIVFLMIRSGIVGFFAVIFKDPFLTSAFIFAILFAFFVGLTTANFGALVRYKIALLPFFNIVLFRVRAVVKGKG